MKAKVEIQIVVDAEGVKCVRIVGATQEHRLGHDLYFQLRDLIEGFDLAVKGRLKGIVNHGESKLNT